MSETTMRERKKEATKANIIKVAIELFNECGFADTTMQLIAGKADVALRTLYNYFPTKEAIVGTYMRDVVRHEEQKHWDELLELETSYERLLLVCRVTSAWSLANPALSEVYASDPRNYFYAPGDAVPGSGIDEVIARIMEMGQEMGDITRDIPGEVLVRQFMGVFYWSVVTWLGNRGLDLYSIFKDGIDILYEGIRARGVVASTVIWEMFC